MQNKKFDAYRKWLGIPPAEQPPNYYRLLGIELFESDQDVISNAADRQMVHIRTFQTGKFSQQSQELLNELSAARVELLNTGKKKVYDEKLRAELESKAAAGVTVVPVGSAPPIFPPVPPTAAPPPVPPPVSGFAPPISPPQMGVPAPPPLIAPAPAQPISPRSVSQKKKQDPAMAIGIMAAAAIFLVFIFFISLQKTTPGPERGKVIQPGTSGGSRNTVSSSHSSTPRKRTDPTTTSPNRRTSSPGTRTSDPSNFSHDWPSTGDEDEDVDLNPNEMDPIDDSSTPDFSQGGLFDSLTIPGREDPDSLGSDSQSSVKKSTASAENPEAEASAPRGGVSWKQISSIGNGFDLRRTSGKKDAAKALLLDYYGGTQPSEDAVKEGLKWLDRRMNAKTNKTAAPWNFDHSLQPTGKPRPGSQDVGTAKEAVNAATSLALMAFLGAGHTPKTGEYRNIISDSLKFLRDAAKPVAESDSLPNTVISQLVANKLSANELSLAEKSSPAFRAHAWSTLVFCEAAGYLAETKNNEAKTYEEIALRLLNHLCKQQNKDGGWPHRERLLSARFFPVTSIDANNSSVEATLWNLMAIKAAQDADLPVDEEVIASAVKYLSTELKLITDKWKSTGRGDDSGLTMGVTQTELIAIRNILLGNLLLREPVNSELWKSVCEQLTQLPAQPGDALSHFLTALLARDMDDEAWESWNKKIREEYVSSQEKSRQELGSWFFETKDRTAAEGGRLYATVMSLLYLESYYRYPLLKDDDSAEE